MKKEEKVIYTTLETKGNFIAFGFLDGEQYAKAIDSGSKRFHRYNFIEERKTIAIESMANLFYLFDSQGKKFFYELMERYKKGKGPTLEMWRKLPDSKYKNKKRKDGIISIYRTTYQVKKVPYSFYKKYVK